MKIYYIGISCAGYAVYYDNESGDGVLVTRHFTTFGEALFMLEKLTQI